MQAAAFACNHYDLFMVRRRLRIDSDWIGVAHSTGSKLRVTMDYSGRLEHLNDASSGDCGFLKPCRISDVPLGVHIHYECGEHFAFARLILDLFVLRVNGSA